MKRQILFILFSLLLSFIFIFEVSAQSSLCIKKRVKVKRGRVNLARAISLVEEGQCPRNTVEVGNGFQGGNALYGDGSNGELIVSESSDLPSGTYLYSTIIINPGVTLTVASGTILRTTGSFINNGTINVRTYAYGGSRFNYDSFVNSSLGQTRPGAGLAPAAAATGDFGDSTGLLKGGAATPGIFNPYSTITIFPTGPLGGGGGAFGGLSTVGFFPISRGGDGGGVFTVLAKGEIKNNGEINASGNDAVGPGAGGGGGGIVNLASQKSIVNDGIIDVSGGSGSQGNVNSGSGGGGGGGLINLVSPLISNDGTTNILGGVGGDNAVAGSVSSIPRIAGGAGGGSAGGGGEGASVNSDGSTTFPFSVPNGSEGRVRPFAFSPKYLYR